MAANEDGPVVAINLISMRAGADLDRFAEFSATVDQPTLREQDVVLGFDVFRVGHDDAETLGADIIEVLSVRSWDEWVLVRDTHPDLEPVTRGFAELADPDAVRTFFVSHVSAR